MKNKIDYYNIYRYDIFQTMENIKGLDLHDTLNYLYYLSKVSIEDNAYTEYVFSIAFEHFYYSDYFKKVTNKISYINDMLESLELQNKMFAHKQLTKFLNA